MTTIFDLPSTNPPNPFSASIQAVLTSTSQSSASGPEPAVSETAARLAATVTASSDPANTLWELWDAFFVAVVTCSTSHAPHHALLEALRAQPPTQPRNVAAGSDAELKLRSYTHSDGTLHWPTLPRFSAQWRDVHDILEAWRDWDGIRPSGGYNSSSTSDSSSSGDKYFLRFCAFSAALLGVTNGKGEVHPIWVFHACRDVLEREGSEPRQPKAHRMSAEQVGALDARVAATWMRDGGHALWNMDQEDLRRHWAAPLDEKTDLWPREDGLTRERWQFWGKRLRALSAEGGGLDEETRAVATEAAKVVEGILEEASI